MTRFTGLFTVTSVTCFILTGAWFGSVLGAWTLSAFDTDVTSTTAAAEAEPLPSGAGYLLIGVNADHDGPDRPLEAIWAVKFASDYATVELLGLPPTAEMKAVFSEGQAEFISLVTSQLRAPLQKQFVLDSEQFIWIIDTLGGVRLSGAVLDGADALDYVRAGRDVGEQLLRQAATVQALGVQVAVPDQHADVSAVLQKVRAGALSQKETSAINDNFSPLRLEHVRVRALEADAPTATVVKPLQ